MDHLDYAALFLLIGIVALSLCTVWQMYVMLTETYTLNRFQNSPKMLWIAVALFFSFSIAVYWICPNARKKGIVFAILGGIGTICYALGMYYKHLALHG